jgi:hypothetical protein
LSRQSGNLVHHLRLNSAVYRIVHAVVPIAYRRRKARKSERAAQMNILTIRADIQKLKTPPPTRAIGFVVRSPRKK